MSDADVRQAAPAALPADCEAYRSTPVFTEATVPPALLRSHRTAPDTWALIHVLKGRLLYRVLDPLSQRVLDPSASPGLVEPGVPHEVAPLGPVRFQVEFHRRIGTDGGVAATAISSRPEAMPRSALASEAVMGPDAHRADCVPNWVSRRELRGDVGYQ